MSLNIILIEKSLVKKEKVSVLNCEGVNQEIQIMEKLQLNMHFKNMIIIQKDQNLFQKVQKKYFQQKKIGFVLCLKKIMEDVVTL